MSKRAKRSAELRSSREQAKEAPLELPPVIVRPTQKNQTSAAERKDEERAALIQRAAKARWSKPKSG